MARSGSGPRSLDPLRHGPYRSGPAAAGPGRVIVVNDQIALPAVPPDRVVYAVPMKKLVDGVTTDVKLRRLVINMIYVGVLAQLLGIDEAEIERALDAQL